MATKAKLHKIGFTDLQAKHLGSDFAKDLTSTGSTQSDAYILVAEVNYFTTVASGTGAKLPKIEEFAQDYIYIRNDGAETLKIYPYLGEFINSLSVNTPITIPTNSGVLMQIISETKWISFPCEVAGGGGGGGTVTSISSGNGMDFSTISTTGSVTLGTPSDITSSSTNSLTSTSHTHALNTTGVSGGSYTNANITVDTKGRITTASNGTAVPSSTDALAEGSTNKYDKTVAFTGGTNVTIGGTYPNFVVSDSSGTSDLALGETSSTAYRGDRGKTAYDHTSVTTGNPHSVTKTDVGLGNVPNTDCTNADNINDGSTKAIITQAQETNFETGYSHSQLTTGNPHSVTKTEVGLGNVPNTDCTNADNISDGTTNKIITGTQETNFGTAYTHSQLTTGNPHSVTKTDVGLANVPNTDCTNASNLSTGTLSDSRLSGNVVTTIDQLGGEAELIDSISANNLKVRTIKGEGAITVTQNANTLNVSYSGSSGDGDVEGPSSSVDNSIPTFDSTTGKIIQDPEGWKIDDSGTLIPNGTKNIGDSSDVVNSIFFYRRYPDFYQISVTGGSTYYVTDSSYDYIKYNGATSAYNVSFTTASISAGRTYVIWNNTVYNCNLKVNGGTTRLTLTGNGAALCIEGIGMWFLDLGTRYTS